MEFRRVPAVFNQRWGHDAAIYYTLEALGLVEKLHRPLFDAIHKQNLRTDSEPALSEWLQKQGVDPKKFMDTMKSFGVQSKTRRAVQQTIAYKIDGTPAMAVAGRYTVGAEPGRQPGRDAEDRRRPGRESPKREVAHAGRHHRRLFGHR